MFREYRPSVKYKKNNLEIRYGSGTGAMVLINYLRKKHGYDISFLDVSVF
jgi:hypothetical protein